MLVSPYVHLIALIAGGLLIFILKKKFPKIYTTEALLIFFLYALLISLYTEPVILLIKNSID